MTDSPTASGSQASSFARGALTLPRRDLALCGVAVWLVVAFVPFFYEQRYTSRAIVYAVVLPFGLVALWRLAAQRNPAAMAGASFLAWALVSSLSAEARWLSILPAMNRQENLFTYAAVFGLWALSRTMSKRGALALGWAFVGAAAVNGVLGVVQVVFGIENGPLSSAFGRATGFSTNPVFFGAVSCGMAAWFAWQLAGTTGMRLATAGTGVASGAALVTLSGSRVALASLLLVVAALSVVARTRRQAAGLVFTVAGIVIGTLIGSVGAASTRRASDWVSTGLSARLHIWS